MADSNDNTARFFKFKVGGQRGPTSYPPGSAVSADGLPLAAAARRDVSIPDFRNGFEEFKRNQLGLMSRTLLEFGLKRERLAAVREMFAGLVRAQIEVARTALAVRVARDKKEVLSQFLEDSAQQDALIMRTSSAFQDALLAGGLERTLKISQDRKILLDQLDGLLGRGEILAEDYEQQRRLINERTDFLRASVPQMVGELIEAHLELVRRCLEQFDDNAVRVREKLAGS